MAKRETPTYGCGGCDNRWTPLGACHCSGCHRTYSGITAFDKHRRYSKCTVPTAKTFVQDVAGIWHLIGTYEGPIAA